MSRVSNRPRGLEFFLSDALFLGMPVFSRVLFFRNQCFSEVGVFRGDRLFSEMCYFREIPVRYSRYKEGGLGLIMGDLNVGIFQRLLSLFDLTSHHC